MTSEEEWKDITPTGQESAFDGPFSEYLASQRRVKMGRLLGDRVIGLIADHLAIPPTENKLSYVISAVAKWYEAKLREK